MEKIKAVRGMHDILPDKSEEWDEIEKKIKETAKLFGFEEIRTPIVEESSLFERSVGNSTEIIEKQMYSFLDKKGRKLALRPEGTAPIVRAFIESNLYQSQKISKFFYYGPMFRYDRPQKGRYREFYQFGAELFGGSHPFFDGEIIHLLFCILNRIKIQQTYFEINSIGCISCQQKFSEILKNYIIIKKNSLCQDCKIRIEKNPLRVMDCKNNSCKEIVKNGPKISDYLCNDCKDHFEKVKVYLETFEIPYKTNPYLVRGLDYYTRTIFEVFVENEVNAIAGGGRYDNLVEELGGPSIPAVGFAIGMERIFDLILHLQKKGPPIYVFLFGENVKIPGIKIIQKIREIGLKIKVDYENRSLKSYLKIADKEHANWCIIIGENELNNNQLLLKNLKDGSQQFIRIEEIDSKLKQLLKC